MSLRFRKLITDGKLIPHDTKLEVLEDIDIELIEKGCKMYQSNIFSMFVCMLSGLLSLMYIPSIVDVLHKTGQSSSPETSFMRYLRTLNHMQRWYDETPKERKESLKTVRRTHRGVASKYPMTQYDMVLTQWAFLGPVLLKPDQFGISRKSQENLDGLRYIIYLVGQALGINDDLNLCSGNLQESKDYALEILENEIQTYMCLETDISREMSHNLLIGMKITNPYIYPGGFKHWTFNTFEINSRAESMSGENPSYAKFFQSFLNSLFDTFFPNQYFGWFVRLFFNGLMSLNVILANILAPFIQYNPRNRTLATMIVTFGLIAIVALFVSLPFSMMMLLYHAIE